RTAARACAAQLTRSAAPLGSLRDVLPSCSVSSEPRLGRAHILQETPEVLNVVLGVIALGEAARIVVVQTISVAAAARSRGERDPTRRCKPAPGRCAGVAR